MTVHSREMAHTSPRSFLQLLLACAKQFAPSSVPIITDTALAMPTDITTPICMAWSAMVTAGMAASSRRA